MEPHKNLGRRGEDYAAQYLKFKKRFHIVDRNFHAQGGEIDIIAWDPREKIYVLVEVKTRKSNRFGDGVEAITPHKIRKMQRASVRFFLWKRKFSEVPDFEIHAMVLTPNKKKGFWQPEFQVEYYDRL